MSNITLSKSSGKFRVILVILATLTFALIIISIFSLAFIGPKKEWTARLPNDTYYLLDQIDDGTILVAGNKHGLTALNQDGSMNWKFEGSGMSAISANGTAYIGTTLTNDSLTSLCAIAPNGQLLWSYPIGNGTFLSIKIGPESMIYSLFSSQSEDNVSYEFLAFLPSGDLLWQQSFPVPISFMVSNNGTLLMCANNGWLTSYSPTGTQLGSVPISIPLLLFPVLSGSTIFQTIVESNGNSTQARLYAINTNGSVLWRFPEDSDNDPYFFANPLWLSVDDNGTSYFVRQRSDGPESVLSVIDFSGSILWEYQDEWIGNLAVGEDMIVITSMSELTALDKDGNVLWTLDGHYYYDVAPLMAADGTIYAITTPFGIAETEFGIVAIDETATPLAIIIVGVVLFAAIIISLVLIWKGR